ncbi:hypothetical protein [Acetivibrio cellulolyticus]|uniref:hypothetical protein n=1 Tax=Acetivibrio cellulolyticus TaxID=35830 RepID=UPI0001E2F66D|nr:hypothetical protein [Acetivibrio cellulolyticus]
MDCKLLYKIKRFYQAVVWIALYLVWFLAIIALIQNIKPSYALVNNSISIETGAFKVETDVKNEPETVMGAVYGAAGNVEGEKKVNDPLEFLREDE